MTEVTYHPQMAARARRLQAGGVKTDRGPRFNLAGTGILVLVLAGVVALHIWVNSPPEAAADTATATATATPDPGPATDAGAERLAPNGLALPPLTDRERFEVDDQAIDRERVRRGGWRDLRHVRIGEISWSDTNPRVRINHFWHSPGDLVKGADGEYRVVRIERNRVLVRNPKGSIREFAPGKLHGINLDLMRDNRRRLSDRIGVDDSD